VPPPKLDMRPPQPSDDAEQGNPESQAPESQAPESQSPDETPKFSPLPALSESADAPMPSTADFKKLAADDAADVDDFDQFEEVDDLGTDEEEVEPEPSPPPPLRKKPPQALPKKPAPQKKQSPWSSGEKSSEVTPSGPDATENETDESDDGFDAFLNGLQED